LFENWAIKGLRKFIISIPKTTNTKQLHKSKVAVKWYGWLVNIEIICDEICDCFFSSSRVNRFVFKKEISIPEKKAESNKHIEIVRAGFMNVYSFDGLFPMFFRTRNNTNANILNRKKIQLC
jgi:hypothetical protein